MNHHPGTYPDLGLTIFSASIAAAPLAVAAGPPTGGGSFALDGAGIVVGVGLTIHRGTVLHTAINNGTDNLIALSEGLGSGGTNNGGEVERDVSPEINPKDLAGKTPRRNPRDCY